MPPPDFVVTLRDPRFKAEMEITIKGEPSIHYASEEIPSMANPDDFQAIVGDGRARVQVTTDVGIKDFGTGASASVSIALTCNQDARTIERAVQLAAETARGYANENQQRAENELQQIMAQRGQVPR